MFRPTFFVYFSFLRFIGGYQNVYFELDVLLVTLFLLSSTFTTSV